MVDVTQIDHITEGLKLLPAQWDDAVVFRGVLESWLKPLNTTEQCGIDVRDGFNINTAIGAQLDIIGAYFNESRGGRTDTEYRNAILAIIASSNGSGTPNQLIDLFATLSGSSEVHYFEHYPLSIAMVSNFGDFPDVSVTSYMLQAAPACIEYVALMYDPFGFGWIGNDTDFGDANLITDINDQIITDVPDNIVVVAQFEQVDDGSGRSFFIDISVDGESIGYGERYGEAYGGRQVDNSQFVDSVIGDNSLTPTPGAGNGFIKWASMDLFDPDSLTSNKSEPIIQIQNSGLLRKQPLPRQFFNWMMATIDAWMSSIADRAPVGAIRMTILNSKTAADFGNQYQNPDQTSTTWAETSGSPTTFAGINTYVFKRTA